MRNLRVYEGVLICFDFWSHNPSNTTFPKIAGNEMRQPVWLLPHECDRADDDYDIHWKHGIKGIIERLGNNLLRSLIAPLAFREYSKEIRYLSLYFEMLMLRRACIYQANREVRRLMSTLKNVAKAIWLLDNH